MKTDISKIVSEAWRITFKNKWLWVFGLVLALSSSGGRGNFDTSSYRDNRNTNSTQQNETKKTFPTIPQPKELLENSKQVLGTATVSVTSLLDTIHPAFIFITVIVVGISFVIFFILGLYLRSWAMGSLVHGIDQENNGISLGLSEMSRVGKQKAYELMLLNLIPVYIILGGGVVLAIVGIGSVLLGSVLLPLGLLLTGLLGIILLIVTLLASVAAYLGNYAVVLKNKSRNEAFKEGWKIFTKYFVDVIVLNCLNMVFGAIVALLSCFLIIPIIAVIGIGVIGVSVAPTTLIILLPIGVLVFLIIIAFMSLVNGVFQVFNESTWVLLYKQLMVLEEGQAK